MTLSARSDCAGDAAPTVSAIIPVHNGGRFLAAALDSVLAQTRPPDEVIVVDDGSTDDTPAVLNAYGAAIIALRQDNRGCGAAVNRGIAAARGGLLAFLDADDLWLPEKLALQLAALAAADAPDLVFGHIEQFVSPELPPERAAGLVCPAGAQPGVHRTTLVARRAVFDRAGMFDESLRVVDFIDWYPRAIDCGLRSAMLPQVVARRRIHDANMGVRLRAAQRADNVAAVKRVLDRRRARRP